MMGPTERLRAKKREAVTAELRSIVAQQQMASAVAREARQRVAFDRLSASHIAELFCPSRPSQAVEKGR